MAIGMRPEVTDYIAWGNLVKSWAKGNKPSPTSLDDLLSQCTAANVGMLMPDYVDTLFVLQKPKNVFVLRLPPGDLIQESENALNAGGLYPIPQFYNDRYHAVLDVPQPQMLDFHAQRTGDYVIRLCL
jgi:hypothetical protein